MALKTMGVVKNYERIRDFSVAIVGVGGVGVAVCEMLTRCGVGKVIIFDHDTIELANMNKMFFRPEQAGWNKTMAVRHYCSELCPDTIFEVRPAAAGSTRTRSRTCGMASAAHRTRCACRRRVLTRGFGRARPLPPPPQVHNMDISLDENRAKLAESLATGGIDRNSPVNLLLGCVDNMAARQALEAVGEELQLPFMDGVCADDAMSGSVQLIIPGRTGGLEAAPIKQAFEKRPGVCAASLATTDSIIAGLMAQNVLKYLLGFGEVAFLLTYNAVTNEFQTR